MSYCRFIEADVYVFSTYTDIECCFCRLQEREWEDHPNSPFGGYFTSVGEIIPTRFDNLGMIEHLRLHQEQGHYVPDYVFDRLADPNDIAENEKFWREHRDKSSG